jgi:hypothetical protein
MNMEEYVTVNFDNFPVRFTFEGKVSVIDVIKALSDSNRPFSLWEKLITEHPEVLIYCEDYSFQKGESLPVVDGKGWKKILKFLPYYILRQGLI